MANTVQKITISNFKNIDFKEVELNGKNVYLVGGNAAGKTSFIDAAFLNMPGKPLKDGTRKGKVTVEIGGYEVEYTFTQKNQKPKLQIFNKEGQPQKAPATLLKEVLGLTDFNIDDFLKLSPAKKIDFIKEITGLEWDDLEAEEKKLYEDRRYLTRQAKELDAKLEGTQHDPKLVPVDIEPLQKVLKTAQDVDRIKNEVEGFKKQIAELQDKIEKGEKWLEEKPATTVEEANQVVAEAYATNEKAAANLANFEQREEAGKLWEQVDTAQARLDEIKEIKRQETEALNLPVKGLELDDEQLYLDGQPFDSEQINTARRIIAGLEIQYYINQQGGIARFDGSLLDKNSMQEVEAWAADRGIQLFVEIVDRNGGSLEVQIVE